MKKIAITQKINPSLSNNIQNTNQMSPTLMQKEVINVKINILKLWNIVPFFIKFLSLSTITLYALNLFFNDISFCLSNIPFYTIIYFNILLYTVIYFFIPLYTFVYFFHTLMYLYIPLYTLVYRNILFHTVIYLFYT